MTTALFIHHSVGRQILREGGLRQKLSASIPSLELWDHDYNKPGLSDASGSTVGRSFPIPGDNTDPDGLLTILRGIAAGKPWAASAAAFDILLLKSCFPNSAIGSDADAGWLKEVYQEMREIALGLSQAVVLLSSPPLALEATRPGQAARAADVATWLGTSWTGPRLGYANIFDTLTYGSGPARGTLRLGYRTKRPRDSHLSVAGAQAAASAIVPPLLAVS